MVLTPASLTGPLVDFATHLIGSLGLAGVALLTTITAIVGVPGTEPTMLFAGFNVYQGTLSLPGIIVAGVFGDVLGASIAYAIGFYGSRELLERQGSKLHLKSSDLDRAHGWFERWGSGVVFVSRMLPLVRAVFPYAAGVARMSYWRFLALATLGSIIWIGALGALGDAVGSNWKSWKGHLEYVDYAAVAVLVAVVAWWLVRRRRANRHGPGRPKAVVDGAPD